MSEPCVRLTEDGYFEFLIEGRPVYDFKAHNPRSAVGWLVELADKTWFTPKHLREFANLIHGMGEC